MRLYIKKFNSIDTKNLCKYQGKVVDNIKIYSTDGMFVVDDKSIYKLCVTDDENKNYCENVDENKNETISLF